MSRKSKPPSKAAKETTKEVEVSQEQMDDIIKLSNAVDAAQQEMNIYATAVLAGHSLTGWVPKSYDSEKLVIVVEKA